MDLFSRSPGPGYVPAFAGRLLLAMARGIAGAKDSIKLAFLEEDVEGMWTLSMVVVQWYASALPPPDASAVMTTLGELEMSSVATNLNLFREQLMPFVKTAHQAQSDAQLAAAGVYFVAAVEQIGLPTLSAAVKSGQIRALQQRLQARMPLPAELKTDYYQALGTNPKGMVTAPAAQPKPSRAERFDRADFSTKTQARPAAKRSNEGARAGRNPLAASSETRSLPPPVPNLAHADVTRAYLHTLGWGGAEVDQFLQGPDGKRRA